MEKVDNMKKLVEKVEKLNESGVLAEKISTIDEKGTAVPYRELRSRFIDAMNALDDGALATLHGTGCAKLANALQAEMDAETDDPKASAAPSETQVIPPSSKPKGGKKGKAESPAPAPAPAPATAPASAAKRKGKEKADKPEDTPKERKYTWTDALVDALKAGGTAQEVITKSKSLYQEHGGKSRESWAQYNMNIVKIAVELGVKKEGDRFVVIEKKK